MNPTRLCGDRLITFLPRLCSMMASSAGNSSTRRAAARRENT